MIKPLTAGYLQYEPLNRAEDPVLLILTATRALKFTYWVTKGWLMTVEARRKRQSIRRCEI